MVHRQELKSQEDDFSMEALHKNGIVVAEVLQDRLMWLENFWLWATFLGDPKSVFCMFFPVAYFLNQKVGVAVLWIALISEWLNLVFKWFLFGERPYWWMHESGALSKYGLIVRQFPSTCETGPGSPSGHCMITGAALWPVLIASSKYLWQRSQSRLVWLVTIKLYFVFMLAVGLSRVFILAHFPHQVLAGIVAGIVLGHVLSRNIPDEKEFRFYVIASTVLLVGASFLYWSMIGIGIDPSWSIRFASKWCSNPKWVRLDTMPFSSVTRCAGNALGLGLTVHSPLYREVKQQIFKGRDCVRCMGLSVALLHTLDYIPLPTSFNMLFYILNFMKNAVYPLIVIAIVPGVMKSLNRGESTPKCE
ncbi:glucose-6-phosphatase 3 isoform X2 [Ambystoma mexicanum]|uniref:glucose-6-phosphatase 3 isoform X2 n=1 Tax=Ambystoma mexicanum TaxID=8296 RepID=UPI0037E7C1D7